MFHSFVKFDDILQIKQFRQTLKRFPVKEYYKRYLCSAVYKREVAHSEILSKLCSKSHQCYLRKEIVEICIYAYRTTRIIMFTY